MGATTKLTKVRRNIIRDVIDENGYIKKIDVYNQLKNHELFRNVSKRYVYSLIEFDFDQEIKDPGHVVTGRSTLIDADGNKKIEWVKTSAKHDKLIEALRITVKELTAEIKPIDLIELKAAGLNKELLNQYTITDFHLGMLALSAEVGAPWNIETAEKLILDWFKHGIAQSPPAESCVFAQIGDFLHFDSLEAVTPTSKHILDADTKFNNLVRVSIRVIRQIITLLLQKYKTVNVVLAEGNHDLASSVWLRESFGALFENNPRVLIDRSPVPYYCLEFGKCLLFYHHGHKRRLKDLDTALVGLHKEKFGKAKHVYAHTGHLHHEKKIETNLMILEQHPTLATADSYSVGLGYKSKRNAKIITYHKEFGEVARLTISPDMVKK